MKAIHLQTEYLKDPMGIDMVHPRLFWNCQEGITQKAYRILASDEDGKTLIGYDLDLINDLQDLLGFEIDGGIQAMDYSALTTSLAENKLDMGAAALCATDERKEVMKF